MNILPCEEKSVCVCKKSVSGKVCHGRPDVCKKKVCVSVCGSVCLCVYYSYYYYDYYYYYYYYYYY